MVMSTFGTVFVVDDDPSVLRSLGRLLRSQGLDVRCYGSPQTFLDEHDAAIPGCAVLDMAMPGLDGLNLQEALTRHGNGRPIIFLSGRGDVPTSVKAMKAGAVDFLTKPVNGRDLLAAVRKANDIDGRMRREQVELQAILQRVATLTPREREVLQHVVTGQLNKQIAADLGTVEKTIKVHRSRVMDKMGTRSVVELVRMTQRAGMAIGNATSPNASASAASP
jgi:FixJ family two-component response regulator